jgi:polyketide cyclase/dehydrase/lipid transport protein
VKPVPPPRGTMTTRVRLQGTVPVAAPLERAFALFTPSGERQWAAGWDPHFPDPPDDETAPGTVFETAHSGPATWVVAASDPPRTITYSVVHAGDRAGLVQVVCRPAGAAGTLATVTYDLTALSGAGRLGLERFAREYEPFLAHWREAITAALAV